MIYSSKKKALFDFITFLITVSSIGLAVWSINIYRDTIIDWKILTPPIIVGIIISLIVFWKPLLNIGYQIWAIVFIGAICGGCLTHFGFMYLNQKYSQSKIISNVYSIVYKGTLAKGRNGCSQPYVVINIEGFEKEVIFPCNISDNFNKYSKLKISCSKGFLGYDVIKEKSLLE